MKTIAVLTDFSERSLHAAHYALLIAQKIRANVLLYNSFEVPDFAMAGHHSINSDYGKIKNHSKTKLRDLCHELRMYIKESQGSQSFLPIIDFQCEEGVVANAVAELEENKDIILMVIGTHGTNNEQAFLMGNNCLQIIDAANTPLLIVPENTQLKNIEKIVLATDTPMADIDYIKWTSNLAKPFFAEVSVINILDATAPMVNNNAEEDIFKKTINEDVANLNIDYKVITGFNIKQGFDWLMNNVNFDIMAMIHRKSNQYDYFLKASVTKNMANITDVPLLVFPYPIEKLLVI